MKRGKREQLQERRRIGLFYPLLLLVVVLILAGIHWVQVTMLRPWLVEFEAGQPIYACRRVFDELFASQAGRPDWGRLYDLSGQGGGAVTQEGFGAYMRQHTAGRELSYVETSAGLSGDRKYIVKAGDEKVAVFTLTREEESGWRLGTVELVLPQTAPVYITAGIDHRVLVDGRELDETRQVKVVTTAAEHYLPEGVHGRRRVTWQGETIVSLQPQVEVLDQNGTSLPVLQSPEGEYYVDLPFQTISPTEEELAIHAAQIRARYMIKAATAGGLRQYYAPDSPAYRAITSNDTWMQKYNSYRFSDPQVSGYCRYSEEVFSVRVAFSLYVTRTNGTVKEYELDSTFFFRTQDGKTLVYDMTNLDPQREITQARLVFLDGENEVDRRFLSSEERSFLPPAVTPPEGKVFAGWAVREEEGSSITMTIRFQPAPDGTVSLPEGYLPEPMELYAVYEDAV